MKELFIIVGCMAGFCIMAAYLWWVARPNKEDAR